MYDMVPLLGLGLGLGFRVRVRVRVPLLGLGLGLGFRVCVNCPQKMKLLSNYVLSLMYTTLEA
jgi:hypothetical protein